MNQTLESTLHLASGPYSRKALDYPFVMRDILRDAKRPGFTDADWGPLAELVDTDEFVRVGNWMERVTWDKHYVKLLTMWAKATDWDFTIHRVTEGDNYAIIEMTEYAKYPDREETYNSVSIYEFNEAGKLNKLLIYLSKAEPLAAAQSHYWDWNEVEAEMPSS